MLMLVLKIWAIFEAHVSLMLHIFIQHNSLANYFLLSTHDIPMGMGMGMHLSLKSRAGFQLMMEKIATDEASCHSPRWYINACVPWVGNGIYHNKVPLRAMRSSKIVVSTILCLLLQTTHRKMYISIFLHFILNLFRTYLHKNHCTDFSSFDSQQKMGQ